MHKNDLQDIYLKSTSEENLKTPFIQKVSCFPFSVEVCKIFCFQKNTFELIILKKIFTEESLRLLIQERKAKRCIRVHLDATGGLVAKPDKICPAVMNHVIVLNIKSNESNDEAILYPVAELITCDQTSLNIEIFLRHLISKISNITTVYHNIADYIVVDWSFAEFNAIIKSQLMTFKGYLDKLYDISEENDKTKLLSFTLVASCSSHLTKVVVKDVRLCFSSKKTQNVVIEMIMEIMKFIEFSQLAEYLQNLLVLFKKELCDNQYIECCKQMLAQFEGNQVEKEEEAKEIEENNFRELYKSSKFFQKYENYYLNISQSKSGPKNPYFNEKFAAIFLKKFVAFLPFFGGPFMNLEHFGTRANNGTVERYFGMAKKENRLRNNSVLTPEKVGRYIEYMKESNTIRSTRIEYKIRTQRLTTKYKSNLDCAKDNWKGKSSSKYFSQNFSKNALKDATKNENKN